MAGGVSDFHTHTFHSDGALATSEHVRRAVVRGYTTLGISDHVGVGGVREQLEWLRQERELIEKHWDINIVIGVELTHVPAAGITEAAAYARECGAELVVVHGETIVEPVEPGTNRAALESGHVDVLGHPGFITAEDVEIAIANDVYLEISARRGHSLTNGHVANITRSTHAKLLVNSDAHEPGDFLTAEFQRAVALAAGIDPDRLDEILVKHPAELLTRCQSRRRS